MRPLTWSRSHFSGGVGHVHKNEVPAQARDEVARLPFDVTVRVEPYAGSRLGPNCIEDDQNQVGPRGTGSDNGRVSA